AFDLDDVAKLVAGTREVQAPFVERKYSPVLVAPVESSGTLHYQRPDLIEKIVVKPRKERLRILSDEVVIEREGTEERRIPLAANPAIAGFAAALRGVLSGDAAALRARFTTKVTGNEASWTLELVPTGNAMRSYVQSIVVGGRAGRVEKIETLE